eukprot:s3584_g5.t1
MSALGDWQERSQLPSSGQMALHYSSAKYATSLKVKALIWGATPELGDHLSWDSITPETAAEARKAGQIEVEKFLRQDRNPVWASTNTFHDVHRRIKLAQSFVKKAEEERQAAAAKSSPKMPASLNGKVLTATLKNGRPLCIILPDAQMMVFEAAYGNERRHRGAYLAVLLRALLAGESIDAANQYIEQRRNTQLHKVINDKGMKKWLHETFRSATVGSPFPAPEGYAATDTSSTHVVVEDGVTLCKHKQADGKAKRLVNPYVTQNAAIETWIGKLGLGDKALLMTARVRRAWAAVGLYYRQVEQDRSKIQLSDLDTMLGETELRDTKQQFWRRYKLRFAPEVHPADTTISRVTREMQKRMLCVYGVWKVKSLQFQLTTSQKKRKVGDSLFVEEGEEEEACTHDYDNYLDKLYTLLLAYAMAGCAGVTGAPEPAQENSLGSDTTKFVSVPLDVVFKYFFRAKRSSAALPSHARLRWLQARDLEERSEWVSKFRESTMTLGQVIQEVYTSRDAHWVPNTSSVTPKKSAEPAAGSTAQLNPVLRSCR